jgi:hypothetical protein
MKNKFLNLPGNQAAIWEYKRISLGIRLKKYPLNSGKCFLKL